MNIYFKCVTLGLIFKTFKVKSLQLNFAFSIANFLLIFCSFLCFNLDEYTCGTQYASFLICLPLCRLQARIVIDGLSLFFAWLTSYLCVLLFIGCWENLKTKNDLGKYLFAFLFLDLVLISVFLVDDLLLFYVFFEMVLLPMFFVIGVWGSRVRKIKASFLFFLFTLAGSLTLLASIAWISGVYGCTDSASLRRCGLSEIAQTGLWCAFFLSLGTKVPMLPAHLWLPEAHVEAPTEGSVLLAGVLLKLGSYGFLRYTLPLCPTVIMFSKPLFLSLGCLGVLYASLTAFRQIDTKRIVAYASVAHMCLVVCGIFSSQTEGIMGSILQSLSHGFVASALFFCIGSLYAKTHTKNIDSFGGITQTMPNFTGVFFFFTLANLGFPLTSSFVGEMLLLLGVYFSNTLICYFVTLSLILGAGYSLWMYNRIAFGNVSLTAYICTDLNRGESLAFFSLILTSCCLGLFSPHVSECVQPTIYLLCAF